MPNKKLKNKNILFVRFSNLKKELDKVRHDETLKKYKILSEAYNLGKRIYGRDYSILSLSKYFELSYTTTKRILSLDRASKKTWQLIKTKKITAFKAAQILLTKNIQYQDKIIDEVIKNNLSTYQIRKINKLRGRIWEKNKLDKLSKVIDKGYSAKSNSTHALLYTIERLDRLLNLTPEQLQKERLTIIYTKLKTLSLKIESFISRIEK